MSLKSHLNNLIKERGYLSAEEMYRICLEEGFKPSNGERRLRKSESPNVEAVMGVSKRGTKYIKGYQLITGKELFIKGYQDLPQLFTYKVYEPVTKFNPPQ